MKVKNRLWALNIIPLFFLLLGLILTKTLISSSESDFENYSQIIVHKKAIVLDIYDHIGFGSGIHNFKNYVIRKSPQYYVAAKESLDQGLESINLYLNSKKITDIERSSLLALYETVTQYVNNLEVVRIAILNKETTAQIDKKVKIDDSKAIKAIRKLSDFLDTQEKELKKEYFDNLVFADYVALSFFLLSLVLVVFININISNKILKSLNSLTRLSKGLKVSQSNVEELSSEMDPTSEFAELQESMLSMNNKNVQIFKRLDRLNKNMNQFAFAASHDLQEPLKKIATYIDLFRLEVDEKHLNTEQISYLNQINDSAERMLQLIDALLEYSRHGEMELKAIPVDLNRVLDFCLQDLEIGIKENQAVIQSEPLPTVMGDQTMLHSLFLNLISNAIKFHQEDQKPIILIKTKAIDSFWRISIEDNGIGFDEKQKANILRPFVRLNSRSKFKGTGIGLATCAKILENHSSFLEIHSELGKGSSFSFLLPSVPSIGITNEGNIEGE